MAEDLRDGYEVDVVTIKYGKTGVHLIPTYYETEERRVRYDVKNNIYALGNPKTNKIKTMFKPNLGKEYFEDEFSKDMDN